MSVGLKEPSTLHPVPGIRFGTTAAGIRKQDRIDLVVIECTPSTEAAAVFTTNRFCAAPVVVAREHLARANPRALVINTGYANAGTGAPGFADAYASCAALARLIDCPTEAVLPFSTGIIGERFPLDRLVAGLPACVANLNAGGWVDAATGIMTTDTMPKGSSRTLTMDGAQITVTGIAKGAGMIRPDMATMLAFIATDARVSRPMLDRCLRGAANVSFNRITVDGDTSTNDACVLLATGRAGDRPLDPRHADWSRFTAAVTEVCVDLAQAIVRDGEGATKFITIEVRGGASEAECLAVAYAIAHSPLVKTAFSASDPNWGRILAAVGRAGVALDVNAVSIQLGDVVVVQNGALALNYTEAKGQAAMRPSEIRVHVRIGAGSHNARLWTCDLSQEYVRINADYRS